MTAKRGARRGRIERRETVVLAFVCAVGRLPESANDLFAAIASEVPNVTRNEIVDAVRWSLRRSEQKGRALERAMRMGCKLTKAELP